MMNTTPSLLLLLSLSLFYLSQTNVVVVSARKNQNRNTPHGHRGKLEPYTPGPFADLQITDSDEKGLSMGKPVMKQIPYPAKEKKEGGRAICVQDVDAARPAVWNQILRLDDYVGKVAKLKECKNYYVGAKADGTVQIKTKMVIGVLPGYQYENYYDHHFSPSDNSVTWQLDYDKTNDFDDVAGHWHVAEHPTKPDSCRVFYACDVAFKQALPKPIMNFVSKSALKQATGWVKKESESKKDAVIPKEFLPESVKDL